jgi:hypothetical protein
LKERFVAANEPIELAGISEVEWQRAYDSYYKRGTKVVRRITGTGGGLPSDPH